MTPGQLAGLPLDSRVTLDGEVGVIIKVGPMVNILWVDSDVTNYVDTNSQKWVEFISWLEVE